MGKIVYGALVGVSITSDADQDIWNLVVAGGARIKLHGFELTSDTLVAELVSLSLVRVSTASTTTGAAITPQVRDGADGALAGSLRAGDTVPGTPAGNLMGWQWEQLGPVGVVYTPEMRPISTTSTSNGFALHCHTSVAMTVSGWECWEES